MSSKSRLSWTSRAIATVALCTFLPVALGGCFGRFELTRKVYKFNQDISPDKWIQWLFFLLISIVPIYGLAVLFDTIVANSMEFWTGDNPVSADMQRTFHGENGEVAVVTYRVDGIMDVDLTAANGEKHFVRLMREQQSIVAIDAQGRFLARVGDLNGRTALLAN
ncbi:MAG: DUF3332 family protein [Deltaproteobacteria bacterium]|nr:DUF3332 family protein [Deltaproteobacteria bacterium]MBW2413897.1 DUF3332 family protein [Deltaproteobacteria bacterium]